MADYIRPTPRNPFLGLLADALTGGVEWMRDPRRAQQMQGLGGLLAETGIPATVERLSYGEPLTTGRGMTTRLRPEAEAALMTLGPEAVPIGRGAMAAVKATKGLPVGAATVYHGSPYRFQRFDPTKIGSGEGAQAYGYGHYVAESPGVAESYRKALSDNVFTVGGKNISGPTSKYGQPAQNPARAGLSVPEKMATYALDSAINAGSSDPAADAIKHLTKYGKGNPDAASALEVVRQWSQQGGKVEAGSLYTIDLPDPAIARMLDWDKPLGQQPKEIRDAINKTKSMLPANAMDDLGGDLSLLYGKEVTPNQFLNTWEAISGSTGSGEEALRRAGIPGIRYLDQGSRSNFRVQNTYKGEPYGEPVSFMTEKQARDYAAEQMEKGFGTNILPGTSNFVVFPGEEDLLRILNVEGGLLGP